MKAIIIKSILLLSLSSLNIHASEKLNIDEKSCSVPEDVMTSILMNEGTIKRELGYEYIIRVNGKTNAKKTSYLFNALLKKKLIKKLGKNVYDCIDKDSCIMITKYIIENGIKNLDLGAFQTNFFYHPSDIETYFTFKGSYLKACKYQHQLINQYGYSWNTIAKYHSKTPKYHKRYLSSLLINYAKIQKAKEN